MAKDFSPDYSERSDNELLLLASDRASLTEQADAALEAELRRRDLTESDQAKHQRLIKRYERQEAKRRHRRRLGTRRDWRTWVELLSAFVVIVLISQAYRGLPSRYHMKPDWEEAALDMLVASVAIAVFSMFRWRGIAFWMSLVVSSSIHLVVVHAWIQRVGTLSRGQGQLAVLLGFVQFYAFNAIVWVLRRKLYGEEALDDT